MSFKTTIAAVLLCLSPFAFAADEGTSTFPAPDKPENTDEWRTHLGVLAGFTDAEGGGYDSAFGYGVDWGIQPYIPFGIGAEVGSTENEGDLTRTTLLGKFTYNFGGETPVIKHSYVGGLLGPVWDSESRNDGVRFGIGPVLGFDIPIGKEMTNDAVTLGMNARYLFVNESAPDTLALNGAMKYWF